MKILDHPTRWQQPADYLTAMASVREVLIRHAARFEPELLELLASDDEEPAEMAPAEMAPAETAAQMPRTLDTLTRTFGLSPFERDLLVLCAAVELDATFSPLIAKAQVDPQRDYPTFGLALAALSGASWQALLPDAPLRYWQMVNVEAGEGLTTGRLRIDERILHYLVGFDSRDERLAGLVEPLSQAEPLVASQQASAERLAATWSGTTGSEDFPVAELFGHEPASKRSVAVEACRLLEWQLYLMPAEALPTEPAELDRLVRLWHRDALLNRSALFLECDELRPNDPREASVRRFVDQSRTGLVVSRRKRMPSRLRPVLSLAVGKPELDEQRTVWAETVQDLDDVAVDGLVSQFNLDATEIRSISYEAAGFSGDNDVGNAAGLDESHLDGIPRILWEACRDRARPGLSRLADRIEPRSGWDDLILPKAQMQTLREIASHMRQRDTVYRDWGFAARSSRGLGIAALFAGSSGTGKTMAAEVLARELLLDLYRIDLSSVVSKYIGETEKNLQQVFDAAEAGGAILLFDEADALFGKRSDVKDSHDRHANIEVSFLLQRMETYRGLAILTTNLKDALDPAFKRRLKFIVEFPFPDVNQRRSIWEQVFPPEAPTEGLKWDLLARLNLTGGHIRNIALNASFLAAERGRAITMRELLISTRREFAKMDRPLAESETRDWLTR